MGRDEPGHDPQAAVRPPARTARGARRGPTPDKPRPSRRRQLYLKVVQPPEQVGRTYDLDDELTIGRSPGCGVAMPDDIYASTLHARLFRRNDQLWVEDLGSTNGTFVNSEQIKQPARLGKGDLLQIGSTVFEVSR